MLVIKHLLDFYLDIKINFFAELSIKTRIKNFRSGIECAGYCLANTQCSAFFWNASTTICQTVSASYLAGDLTSLAVDGYIDKTLKPGLFSSTNLFQEI